MAFLKASPSEKPKPTFAEKRTAKVNEVKVILDGFNMHPNHRQRAAEALVDKLKLVK